MFVLLSIGIRSVFVTLAMMAGWQAGNVGETRTRSFGCTVTKAEAEAGVMVNALGVGVVMENDCNIFK